MLSSNNGHIRTIDDVMAKADERNDGKPGSGHDFTKKLGIYCREYCDYTGIHGFKYFGERRTCIEK